MAEEQLVKRENTYIGETTLKHRFMLKNTKLILGAGFLVLLFSCCTSRNKESEDKNLDTQTSTQAQKSSRASPPAMASGQIGTATINIHYSQPSVKGRTVWGDLVSYNQVWRTGANEATVFETSSDILVEGEHLPAGKYAFFTIPTRDSKWTLIFNKVHEQWGAYDYNAETDALRIKAQPKHTETHTEQLTFSIENNTVVLRWEQLELPFSIDTPPSLPKK